MKITDFIKRHSVLAYFILAFAISWTLVFEVAWPKFSRGQPLGFNEALLMFLPTLAGPSIASIALTGLVDGREGLRDLFCRIGRWRVGWRWYSPVLIFPVLILAVQLCLAGLRSPDFLPYFFPMGIVIGLFAGFFEEIGWMGFAFPRMQLRQSALAAAVLLGVLHSVWHIVPDYLGASVARGAYWLPHFAMFALAMTAMRVILAWTYVNTKSVLISQLMHASSTGFLSILVPLSLSPQDDTLLYAVYGIVLWAVVAVIVTNYRKALNARSVGPVPLSPAQRGF
jgi:membrane protease YdiL (CAAX protease family)